MKLVCGLGNPGPEYEATRHNVGWWLVDRLSVEWGLGPFRRTGDALGAEGRVGEHAVRLVKPLTMMNNSGAAVAAVRARDDIESTEDLLVVVDDVALEVGRVRFRARGSSGGHNGLASIERALGTREYPRLRIGVGGPPSGTDLVDWVLSPFPSEQEERIVDRLAELVEAVELWLNEGMEATMNRYNG